MNWQLCRVGTTAQALDRLTSLQTFVAGRITTLILQTQTVRMLVAERNITFIILLKLHNNPMRNCCHSYFIDE